MDRISDNEPDWGPFNRQLFENPKARDLSRVGVIDIGSNSVRLVVFDGAARSPAYFFNEKVMCALGAGLAESGKLNREGRIRALSALRRFCTIAKGIGLPDLTAVATAAVREASDGPSFVTQVFKETGLQIHVVDGPEEARLSAQGVLLGWPGSYGLVCDIGGASMELAEISNGQVGQRLTSPLGPLKLINIEGGKRGQKAFITQTLDELRERMGPQSDRLFLVGGSWRAIARIDMHRRGYPLHVMHEYRMTARDIRKTASYIDSCDLEELRATIRITPSRMALVPIAIQILKGIIKRFKPHDIAVSSYGIREGMLFEQMPQIMRDRDPLIESCHFSERKDARLPGFGMRLHKFISPLFLNIDPSRARLVRAACLLHDVSWRAHPDFRAEVCFEYAARANLGGLSHHERVFLGLALLHRYRNKSDGTRFEELFSLLGEEGRNEAEILGKAMRLGAMLWANPDDETAKLNWSAKKKSLSLTLTAEASPLFGEVAEARLQSLAQALNATPNVHMKLA
jgi:exopolyphosphatase/guanosine-5'-triphosphate,3'-diphosphate pyrophosphatase